MTRKRNYSKEYKDFHGTAEQKARRAARGRHRYKMEKAGRIKKGQEVEHRNGNAQDGSAKNLTVRSKAFQRRQGGLKTRGNRKK